MVYTFQRWYSYPCFCCSQRPDPHIGYTIIGVYNSLEEIIKNKKDIYEWHNKEDTDDLRDDEERKYTITKFDLNTSDCGKVVYEGENIYSTMCAVERMTRNKLEDDVDVEGCNCCC